MDKNLIKEIVETATIDCASNTAKILTGKESPITMAEENIEVVEQATQELSSLIKKSNLRTVKDELQTLVLYAPQLKEGQCNIHDKAMERIEEINELLEPNKGEKS